MPVTSLGRQLTCARGVEQAIKAVFEPDDLDSSVERRLDHRANDGVEARRIAAAGQHANLSYREHPLGTIPFRFFSDRSRPFLFTRPPDTTT